jgi:HK97 family phage major capsid protein/HK97 family phage prohead protease
MPLPSAGKFKDQAAFMAACVPEASTAADGSKRPNDQAVAMCLQAWRDAHGGKKPSKSINELIARWKRLLANDGALLHKIEILDTSTPASGESEADFIERCVDELTAGNSTLDESDAEDACQTTWDDFSDMTEEPGQEAGEELAADGIVHKVATTIGKSAEFVLSDATPDRFGDIVEVDGWEFANFIKNPVALFSHRADFPIGTWANIRKQDKALRGNLILAPKGISPRIDEIRGLVEAGILRAVSVGFKPLASRPVDPTRNDPFGMTPQIYTKSELVECSLVSIPANPNALAVAKSLKISPETQQLVFAKSGNEKTRDVSASARTLAKSGREGLRASAAKSGETRPVVKGQTMLLSKRIEDGEKFLGQLREQLQDHLSTVDDQNPDDSAMAVTEELNVKISNAERNLGNLRAAEQRLASTNAGDRGDRGGDPRGSTAFTQPEHRPVGAGPRPFSFTPKKMTALDYLFRQGVIEAFAHAKRRSIEETRQIIYGNDECTKAYVDYCQRAASAAAMTTVTGWAAELVQQVYGDFLQILVPTSVMPNLANLGLALTFGRAGRIVIPSRSATPSLAGSFVGEGQPIPVRQGAFTTQTLTPKKLGVITSYTREMDEHSIPAIEGVLRDSVAIDTGVAIDAVLMDANPATAIRPAGLRNGVTGLTPTAGGGFNALVGDIKQLAGALLTATAGHIRVGVFLINPQQALSISLIQPPAAATPLFPFTEEVAAGRLRSFRLITSGNVPLGTVIALDAADFVTVGSEAPRFEVSDQATLHFEDTAPTDITGGTPSPAVPVRSMFQTDSIALKLVWPLNWTLRRPNMVSWVTGVTW